MSLKNETLVVLPDDNIASVDVFANDPSQIDYEAAREIVVDIIANAECVVEMAVIAETPTVAFGQQVYVHIPVASYTRPGIMAFSKEHFEIRDGKLYIRGDINIEGGGSSGGTCTDTTKSKVYVKKSEWILLDTDEFALPTYYALVNIDRHGFANPCLLEAVEHGIDNTYDKVVLHSYTRGTVLHVFTQTVSNYILTISGDFEYE